MDAFQEGFPDPVIFLTFGHSLPWMQSERGKRPLAECDYGLLAPFLDGMLEAARGRARLVDGHELSYGFRDPTLFAPALEMMRTGVLPIVGEPGKYRRHVSPGFGIWLDHDWRKLGWDVDDPSRNFYSPGALEASTRAALEAADEYVWIYSETPRWWSEGGVPEKLPGAYAEALRKARESAAGGK